MNMELTREEQERIREAIEAIDAAGWVFCGKSSGLCKRCSSMAIAFEGVLERCKTVD